MTRRLAMRELVCLFFLWHVAAGAAAAKTTNESEDATARPKAASEPAPRAVPASVNAPASDIEVDYDDDPSDEVERDFATPLEQIFRNPAVVAGLASGADAVNRSVETLMDALFYSLLDNELKEPLSRDAWMRLNFKRDLFATPSGAYVVVDRVDLGPRYARELWRAHGVPVSLGLDGSVEVMQIYLRNDGMRLSEQSELPRWRRWANNWFGLLPAAARFLPPSFNQNELYDPLRQLETPFAFPRRIASFYEMPIGSIRSYAIAGGAQVSADIAGMGGQAFVADLDRAGGLRASMPFALFQQGDYRINVLRRSEHIAWVGLKKLVRRGHVLTPRIGETMRILKGALAAQASGAFLHRLFSWRWLWPGAPLAIFPTDLEFGQARSKPYDQVYEFDLAKPMAQEAYLAAVKGDFSLAHHRYLDSKEKKIDTGVIFHFTRVSDRSETSLSNGPNLAVLRGERKKERIAAEVEVVDRDGKFYVLEGQQDMTLKRWDLLNSDEQERYRAIVEMKVRRIVESGSKDASHFNYVFEMDRNPITLMLTFSIQDRFVDVGEYREYLEQLRFFTAMPLDKVPSIDLQDEMRRTLRRLRSVLVEPHREAAVLHVTPTHLGEFGAQAYVHFSYAVLEEILNTPEDRMWRAFALAFGDDSADWGDAAVRASLRHRLKWWTAFLLYPVRLVNVRLPWADIIAEVENAVEQLLAIKRLSDPREKLERFYALFESDHPAQLARALLTMAPLDQVPRRVSFRAQPKGQARQEIKATYGRLNNKAFRAGPDFPPQSRYEIAQQKMAAFYLDQPRNAEARPAIARLQVSTQRLPLALRELRLEALPPSPNDALAPLDYEANHLYMTVKAKRVDPRRPLKLYLKVEEGGKVKIGKLALAERVVELLPLDAAAGEWHAASYGLFLSGPLSVLADELSQGSLGALDALVVTLAVSQDGNVWSDARQVDFSFSEGRLRKAEK